MNMDFLFLLALCIDRSLKLEDSGRIITQLFQKAGDLALALVRILISRNGSHHGRGPADEHNVVGARRGHKRLQQFLGYTALLG